MANGILHWGHRSHTDTTAADQNHGLIVPVTLGVRSPRRDRAAQGGNHGEVNCDPPLHAHRARRPSGPVHLGSPVLRLRRPRPRDSQVGRQS